MYCKLTHWPFTVESRVLCSGKLSSTVSGSVALGSVGMFTSCFVEYAEGVSSVSEVGKGKEGNPYLL